MSKIVRYTGNLQAFGSAAQGTERTVFGGTSQANDLTSQITSAFLRGWGIVGPSENPSMEDFNAAMYTMSQFIAYQHQMGVPEWDSLQEYYTGSVCSRNGEIYLSLSDNNVGSAPPSAKWTLSLTAKNAAANISGFLKTSNNLSEIAAAGAVAQADAIVNLGIKRQSKWVSSGQSLATNTPVIVTHGLTIDPSECILNIRLRCVTANNGYAVGDYAVGFAPRISAGDTAAMAGSLGAVLTATTAQFNVGSSGVSLMPKTNGSPVAIGSLSQWVLEFVVIY
ncbi:carbohydrate-binding protein [Erwinia rhapontici]|uniref:carbohydrate-binding protein n=1 Tax=Erwinia rhapontici TaxID=55212 RepID=UPI001D3EA9FE|nr:carbohydrate-binding protein [Erwinia rhapontici]MBP2156851.1 hypothetical protein [Erwinia rhapontici]